MTAFLETLAPVEILFIASALLGAFGILTTTVWLAIASGIRRDGRKKALGDRTRQRILRIVLAGDGFMVAFGVAGIALRRLAGADPLWSVIGAVGAGVMLVGVTLPLEMDEE